MTKASTRQRIIECADELFYEQGFEHTSFAHIAEAVNISRGNFYHHFKTKDDILAAVIDWRVVKTQQMLDDWQAEGASPEERIRCFIRILIMNKARIKLYGCPLGTLSNELAKLDHASQPQANQLFLLFRDWLAEHFLALGFDDKADQLAMYLLAQSQGVATLAAAFRDEEYLYSEVDRLNQWLETLIAEHAISDDI